MISTTETTPTTVNTPATAPLLSKKEFLREGSCKVSGAEVASNVLDWGAVSTVLLSVLVLDGWRVITSVFGDPVIVTTETASEEEDPDVTFDDKAVLEIVDNVDGLVLDDVINEVVSSVDVVDNVVNDEDVSVVDDFVELVDVVVLLEVGDCDDEVDAADDVDSGFVDEAFVMLDDEACAMPLGLLRRM